jgi:hypothetical protein
MLSLMGDLSDFHLGDWEFGVRVTRDNITKR